MTSNFYGYSGFYGEHCLRSSLEYIYARYLDYMNIGWTYEHKTYTLSNGVRYKPDFLLETGEYVEIKGAFNFTYDLPKVQLFQSEYNVKVTILQEKDLRQLIKPTPFIFEHLKQELNKLKSFFQPLWDSIQKEHNILDIRTICQIVVGKPCSRKEFLYHLQSYVQKVRGATGNIEPVELEDKKPLG